METADIQYHVNEVYHSIQGEGHYTGTPMTVLRLHGCDVGCPWCDTKQTWEPNPANEVSTISAASAESAAWCQRRAWEIAEYVLNYEADMEYDVPWVLITGGEPALFTLAPLVACLQLQGKKVAVETSGTAYGVLNSGADWVTVSPKLGMPGGKEMLPECIDMADELKFVVGKEGDLSIIQELVRQRVEDRGGEWPLVCLQPISQAERATDLCVQWCLQYGYHLSPQMHKYLDLP